MTQAWIREFPGAVVRLRGVSKRYGGKEALAGLDLEVPAGAVYALVGPNGAGKSTTLRVLLDLARRDGGGVEVLGEDPRAASGARGRIGYVPERHEWGYSGWRAGDAIHHHRLLYPRWDDAYARRLDAVLRVDPRRRLYSQSKGEARRLQLLLALAPRPDLLLLDEPTDGLDPVVRDEVWGVLAAYLAESGATALVSTHHVHEVELMATHYGAIHKGRLLAQLSTSEVRACVRDYRLSVPDGWTPRGLDGSAVVWRRDAGAAFLTVIGEQDRVTDLFRRSGAEVLDSHRPTLEETTLRLLAHGAVEDGS
jgi:ABC-2 type transport system ATP-binding protein